MKPLITIIIALLLFTGCKKETITYKNTGPYNRAYYAIKIDSNNVTIKNNSGSVFYIDGPVYASKHVVYMGVNQLFTYQYTLHDSYHPPLSLKAFDSLVIPNRNFVYQDTTQRFSYVAGSYACYLLEWDSAGINIGGEPCSN